MPKLARMFKEIMKKKYLILAVTALILVAFIAGLSGCFGTIDNNHTITFYVDSNVYETITITPETTGISLPAPPTKDGFIFDDWYYDKNVWEEPFTGDSIADGITGNIRLYAKFNPDPATLIHTVSYSVDGSVVHTVTVTEGDAIPPYTPSKTGYTFDSWSVGGSEAPTVMGTEDLTLIALFSPNTYKIYFELSVGESFAPGASVQTDTAGSYIAVTYDSPYADALDAVTVTKSGGVFAYWEYLGGEYHTGAVYDTAGNITLTPVWAKEGTLGLTYAYVAVSDSYEVATNSSPIAEVIIPMTHNGTQGLKPVTGIRYIRDASITSIEIQNSVTKIHESALELCSNLLTVLIASSVQTIEDDVFPFDSGITIYCKASEAPAGWESGWECGNTVFYNNEEYPTQTYDVSNPEAIEVEFDFAFDTVMISDIAVVDYTDITGGCDITGNTLTIPPATLAFVQTGNYIVRVYGIVSAYFMIDVYDDMYRIQYDKADSANVTRTFWDEMLTGLRGGGILSTDYTFSGGSITIYQTFLNSLKGGEYELLLEGNDFAEILTLTVTDSEATPYNVKLDCDLNAPDYTILFDCDHSASEYSYKIDDGPYYLCESGDTISALDTSTSHTLTIRCDDTNNTATSTLPAMDAATTYLAETFTWGGTTYNKYLADQSELNAYIAYLTHLGCTTGERIMTDPSKPYGYVEGSVYVSDTLKTEITAGSSTSLNIANRSFDFPWSINTGSSILGNIATFTITYISAPVALYSTGLTQQALDDNRTLATGSRLPSFNGFAINSFTKTEIIDSVQELDSLPYGIKPVFSGTASSLQAQSLYQDALDVCRTYLDESMSDYQKVAAIYDWLAIHVTYDGDAISLMELQAQVESASSLTVARDLIDSAIGSHPNWSAILTPVRNKTTIDELQEEFENVMKGLKVFHLQGVFDDGLAVCDGIASAFKLMCLIEGIECIEVSGWAGEAHAWNKVKIDGDWFVVDPTWARINSDTANRLTRQWLLITDQTALTGANPHRERNKYNQDCIQTLATGNYDYYDEFDIGGGYDLVANSQTELNAIIEYYYDQGYNTAEFRYNMSGATPENDIQNAVSQIENVTFSYIIQPANDKDVWIVDISNFYS